MKKQKSDAKIVLYPPRIFVNEATNKYNLVLDFQWGNFGREITVSREEFGFVSQLIKELNAALLEGSESTPYDS